MFVCSKLRPDLPINCLFGLKLQYSAMHLHHISIISVEPCSGESRDVKIKLFSKTNRYVLAISFSEKGMFYYFLGEKYERNFLFFCSERFIRKYFYFL
jgi:hypothetical protein